MTYFKLKVNDPGLALCEADNALDLSPNDQGHEERSKPLDAEVEEAFRLECRA